MNEKRHFKRIPMDGQATLSCGPDHWRSQLIDISLKGALIVAPPACQSISGQNCTLELQLDSDVVITMEGSVIHCNAQHIGFRCDHIGIESISHLKRLVELNLGDETLLERELTELSHSSM